MGGVACVIGGLWLLGAAIDPIFQDLDMHASYANYEEAIADGAKTRGWIPDFVPESATNLRESHNLDLNTQWLTFQYDADDLSTMLETCDSISRDEVDFPSRGATRLRPWWPGDLLGWPNDTAGKYGFYAYDYTTHYSSGPETDRCFLAIDEATSTAWFWRP